ncbi:MAG TPA: hybrid sensor histidine kinase/response regulator [Gammaproteobacteria bacterium]|nr:hybrid sensor histidine kinase/response regulator [Gammaproteobacteria bacterium]
MGDAEIPTSSGCVRSPLFCQTTRMDACMESVVTSPAEHSQHLLVVDDIESNRELMRLQLQRYGYRISLAEDGEEALAMIARDHFDLVLLDIRMPSMDGIEVLQRIRCSYSQLSLPVIMVTAEDQEQRLVEALRVGANDYLAKPLRLPVTLARIEAQLSVGRLATMQEDVVRFTSHDLKKPLLVMMDIAGTMQQELQQSGAMPADSDALLDLLIRTGQNMEQVISGFLDQEGLGHGQEPLRRVLDLNQALQKSLRANVDYATRKGIVLNSEFAEQLPSVQANEFRLCQIMDNLIGNALKFSPRQTHIVVRTRTESGYVVVEIEDNGPGLDKDDFSRLFTKHARLSNRPTGNESSSGLGLAMCKQLIALDNGVIGARNNVGSGATFWIRLPASTVKEHSPVAVTRR